jgi:hypothetical protein
MTLDQLKQKANDAYSQVIKRNKDRSVPPLRIRISNL